MEANMRWVLLAAVAPVAWGANYYVTKAALPPGDPLYGGAIRAVPAGLLLFALRRKLPRGAWWWRSALLGVLNAGGFFALVYLAAQRLPTSTAATVMAASPLVMALIAWPLIAERPRAAHLLGAAVGIGGVCLMLWGGSDGADPLGVAASVGAMLLSSLGYVLAKRWGAGVDVLASTCWQLLAGGLLLLPFAAVFEGAPPALGARALLGFGYVAVIATAVAFTAWFAALRHLPAATVGLVGLLNPVTGVLLGTAVAHEPLTARQLAGLPLVLAGVLLGRPGAAPTRRPRPAVTPPAAPEPYASGPAEPATRPRIFAPSRRPSAPTAVGPAPRTAPGPLAARRPWRRRPPS
ncbi:EamA family transporter [Streptomyces sp. NPDC088194]|uniref:DMT family transporter n=1 Tax=Streptomyces sp. NPDC088194 TaxID=3154931 RepID=UPI00344F4CB4